MTESDESLPSDIEEIAEKALGNVLPVKSKERYEAAYTKYQNWCRMKGVKSLTNEKFSEQLYSNAISTCEGSKSFLKKLLPAAVSFIVYKRINFDRTDFVKQDQRGVQYTLFKTKPNNSILRNIQSWTLSAIQALDKNFLREVYIIISIGDLANIVESYKLQFKNFGNHKLTKSDLKKSTTTLLQSIGCLSEHALLDPAEIQIRMAVTYFEDVTPPEYHPPHFLPDETSVLTHLSSHSTNYISLGRVETGFHSLKCRGKADMFSVSDSFMSPFEEECEITQKSTREENQITDMEVDDPISNQETRNESSYNPSEETTYYQATSQTPIEQIIISDEHVDSNQTTQMCIECPCTIEHEFMNIDLIWCFKCYKLQHTVCEGYLNTQSTWKQYTCSLCKYPEETQLQRKERKLNAIHRLTIVYAYFSKSFPQAVLEKLSPDMRKMTINKLEVAHLINKYKNRYTVNMDTISHYLKGLFGNINIMPDSIDLCSDSDE